MATTPRKKFDPTAILEGHDNDLSDQLDQVIAQLHKIGGGIISTVRDLIVAVDEDDKSTVEQQLANAKSVKELLTLGAAGLKDGINNRPSHPTVVTEAAAPPVSNDEPSAPKAVVKSAIKKTPAPKAPSAKPSTPDSDAQETKTPATKANAPVGFLARARELGKNALN